MFFSSWFIFSDLLYIIKLKFIKIKIEIYYEILFLLSWFIWKIESVSFLIKYLRQWRVKNSQFYKINFYQYLLIHLFQETSSSSILLHATLSVTPSEKYQHGNYAKTRSFAGWQTKEIVGSLPLNL